MSLGSNTLSKRLVTIVCFVLCSLSTAYAVIAYQAARAAAAMPFAMTFDERHFWVPAGIALVFLATAIVTLFKHPVK